MAPGLILLGAVMLSKSGREFGSEEYMSKTPEWAVFGKGTPGDGGFDPAETHFRRGKPV